MSLAFTMLSWARPLPPEIKIILLLSYGDFEVRTYFYRLIESLTHVIGIVIYFT